MKNKLHVAIYLIGSVFFYGMLAFAWISCKKISVDPPATSITDRSAYNTDLTASAVLTGIYARFSANSYMGTGVTSISQFAGLSSDEFQLWQGVGGSYGLRQISFYTNNLTVSGTQNKFGPEFWNDAYPIISICNNAIEGLSRSNGLTEVVKNHLIGEAKFIRAFLYFYLVNLYGDVPLVLSTDYKVNSTIGRSAVSDIYNQIIDDLKSAEESLSDAFVDATILTKSQERTRPTRWAAKALLARVYLYLGKYADSELLSSAIIGNRQLFDLTNLESVFLRNSKEAIWQLQPVNSGWNTEDARLFIVPATGFTDNNPISLSSDLINSFEQSDNRRTKWIDSVSINGAFYFYPYKYKKLSFPITVPPTPASEYQMVLRLGEQYLIRAEARARQGNIVGSQEDLNVIRHRAGLSNTSAQNQDDLIKAIGLDKRIEMFSEWGHRWLDIKRTNSIDTIMKSAANKKGGVWQSYKKLYPIGDVPINPNLSQNLGY